MINLECLVYISVRFRMDGIRYSCGSLKLLSAYSAMIYMYIYVYIYIYIYIYNVMLCYIILKHQLRMDQCVSHSIADD